MPKNSEELEIVRGYPNYYSIEKITRKLHGRWNYTPDDSPTDFDIYYEFTQHVDFQPFCLWAYEKINPNTNRRLSENGLVYKNIGFGNKFKGLTWNFLKTIDSTDREKYREDTDDIIEEYKAELEKQRIRNNKILIIRRQIHSLPRWDQYVVFEGKRYGNQKFHNNTHYYENCLGKRTFATDPELDYPYICNKCGCVWKENYARTLWNMRWSCNNNY